MISIWIPSTSDLKDYKNGSLNYVGNKNKRVCHVEKLRLLGKAWQNNCSHSLGKTLAWYIWKQVISNATYLRQEKSCVLTFRDKLTKIHNEWLWPLSIWIQFTSTKPFLSCSILILVAASRMERIHPENWLHGIVITACLPPFMGRTGCSHKPCTVC